MEVEVDDKELKAAGAEPLTDGRYGLRIHVWDIESRKRSILSSSNTELWEQKLHTCHVPEMVFGDIGLFLEHVKSGATIHFNSFDALVGWKKEALPPVEVPAAAQWKFRTLKEERSLRRPEISNGRTEEKIDVVALASKEPILFYDEVVLYEDELADIGVSLLTVKVLRVDGALMRLRDTRMHCSFSDDANPIILRERCWREATFQALSAGIFFPTVPTSDFIILPLVGPFLSGNVKRNKFCFA
ncbi:TIP41-like protein isoform X2 [Malus sylvestris]|uniref:TIP41-like protein isoform X2 n=1 Tax=Malus sylvestris TaxID=3752 RepID=UPI0021AB9BED|nr:TIP41-like protein isoform X2 [Malus sylvestris]